MTRIIVALFFALCVAIFAVINVRPAPVHYLFGVTNMPLVLIILGAALFGGLIVGLLGAVGHVRLRRERRRLQQYIEVLEREQAPSQIEDEVFSDEISETDDTHAVEFHENEEYPLMDDTGTPSHKKG